MSLGVFWLSIGLIVYTYAVFPLLLALRALLRRRDYAVGEITPSLSLVICAHNEAASIAAKLENALALDYPPEQLEIVVASDGSDDGTDAIVRGFAGRGVRLLALPRRGKIPALNDAVEQARGEILVFSDANSVYAPGALRALARPFADPAVGGVAGDQRYLEPDESADSAGERAYWQLDRWWKSWESRAGSATSATGAIHALRRALFEPVPPAVTDDFFISTSAIARGRRLVFTPEAIAWERVAASSDAEFRRKVRVITRGLRAVLARRALLNPLRHGFYSLQLFSHKLLRRLMALPLLGLFATSLLLWNQGSFYAALASGQVVFYAAALLGAAWGPRRPRPLALPFFFCLVNAATLVALANLLRGRRIDSWQPERPGPQSVGGLAAGGGGRR